MKREYLANINKAVAKDKLKRLDLQLDKKSFNICFYKKIHCKKEIDCNKSILGAYF